MSGSSFAPILLNSFKVIASLFLQYVVGALVACAGVIKEADMRAFSAVMNAVLIPVLSVVSLGLNPISRPYLAYISHKHRPYLASISPVSQGGLPRPRPEPRALRE